jgi:DNA-binding transcriptional LysR family regulator
MPVISLQLVDGVDAGELDLAIAIRPPLDLPPHLVWIPLLAEDYAMLVLATEEADDWRQIIGSQPFIRYDRSSFGGRQVDRFLRREGVAIEQGIEADDLQAMVALVAGAAGCAIVPMTEALGRLPRGVRSVTLGPTAPKRLIGIVHQAPLAAGAAVELIESLVAASSTCAEGAVEARSPS